MVEVNRSDTEAFHLYEKAVIQGHADTQFDAGVIYEHGRSVKQSNTEALRWLTQAFELGQLLAQQQLISISTIAAEA